MILLTDDLRDRLLANGRQRDIDHVPVVKFFNPVGAGTWLITEMEADGDTLFGLFDKTRTIRRSIIEEGQDDARPDFGRGDH